VPGEIQKVVVTSVVMRHFCILSGAPRACADFCDPTAVSRLKVSRLKIGQRWPEDEMYNCTTNFFTGRVLARARGKFLAMSVPAGPVQFSHPQASVLPFRNSCAG